MAAVLLSAAAAAAWEPRHLVDVYASYDEAPVFDHWLEYSEFYERHLPKPDGNTLVSLLEIGVQSGGSARVWKQASVEGLNPSPRYVWLRLPSRLLPLWAVLWSIPQVHWGRHQRALQGDRVACREHPRGNRFPGRRGVHAFRVREARAL